MATIGSSITWVAYFWNSAGTAYVTGLTVNLTVYDETGTALGSPVAMTARADGGYQYTLAGASVDMAGVWSAKAEPTDTSGTLVGFVMMTEDVAVAQAVTLADGAITTAKFGAGAINAAALAADAAAEIADAVLDEALADHTVAGSTGAALTAIKAQTDSLTFTDGKVHADVKAINASTTAAVLQALAAGTMVSGVVSGTPTTTSIPTTLTEATNEHYSGRSIYFTSGALVGQGASISSYNGTSKTLTVTALTEAPAASDSFVII